MQKARTTETSSRPERAFGEPWLVRLFIAGATPTSMAAIRNLKTLEAEYFPAGSTVEVIDLLENPAAAQRDHILAIPTLVRVKPAPLRRVIGNLNDLGKTLAALGLA
jgi:circadian clock protein KaiB